MIEHVKFDSRAAWLDERRKTIGGSDAPAVVGVSPWASPATVYYDKIAPPVHSDATESQMLGRYLEPAIIRLWGECFAPSGTAYQISGANGDEYSLARNSKYPWAHHSPDGQAVAPDGSGALLEVKYTSLVKDWESGPPLYVQVQVQHGLAVLDLPRAHVLTLFAGSSGFESFVVVRDDEFIERMMAAEERFYERLEQRVQPELDGSKHVADALGRLYQRDDGGTVELPDAFAALAERYDAICREQSALNESRREIESMVKAELQHNAVGLLPDGSGWTWKTQSRKEYTVAASSFRVLRRKGGTRNARQTS